MTAVIELELADEAATMRLGGDLALGLRAGDVLALHGDLGAGKTTLARALIRSLADDPALPNFLSGDGEEDNPADDEEEQHMVAAE